MHAGNAQCSDSSFLECERRAPQDWPESSYSHPGQRLPPEPLFYAREQCPCHLRVWACPSFGQHPMVSSPEWIYLLYSPSPAEACRVKLHCVFLSVGDFLKHVLRLPTTGMGDMPATLGHMHSENRWQACQNGRLQMFSLGQFSRIYSSFSDHHKRPVL